MAARALAPPSSSNPAESCCRRPLTAGSRPSGLVASILLKTALGRSGEQLGADPRQGQPSTIMATTLIGGEAPVVDAETIPSALWKLTVPLHITHADAGPETPPFVAAVPRFSYLAQLLPRLRAFFGPAGLACAGFRHEDIELRNLAVGLLADLYRPAQLPWRLVVGPGDEWHVGDTFLNGAKEADFVRRGSAKVIMGLSMEDTTALWNAVQDSECCSGPRKLASAHI